MTGYTGPVSLPTGPPDSVNSMHADRIAGRPMEILDVWAVEQRRWSVARMCLLGFDCRCPPVQQLGVLGELGQAGMQGRKVTGVPCG